MCTLTYRLTQTGYELFFNRDEQRSRSQAVAPHIDYEVEAIYPVDPIGKGTWLAVNNSGLSLALLNYYHAEKLITDSTTDTFISRGEIILKLLAEEDSLSALKNMNLAVYQPFQLCLFPSDLTDSNNKLHCFQWDGVSLMELEQNLPITSSGVDYPEVYQARKETFKEIVSIDNPSNEELWCYHQSQQKEGKLSVKMSREDARTVSFSRILVDDKIEFEYVDYLNNEQDVSIVYMDKC